MNKYILLISLLLMVNCKKFNDNQIGIDSAGKIFGTFTCYPESNAGYPTKYVFDGDTVVIGTEKIQLTYLPEDSVQIGGETSPYVIKLMNEKLSISGGDNNFQTDCEKALSDDELKSAQEKFESEVKESM